MTAGMASCSRSRPSIVLFRSSIQWSGSSGGDDSPTESVSFAFAKVLISYSKQDEAKGTMAPAGTASWDATLVAAS